jgi:hypothetical protein
MSFAYEPQRRELQDWCSQNPKVPISEFIKLKGYDSFTKPTAQTVYGWHRSLKKK